MGLGVIDEAYRIARTRTPTPEVAPASGRWRRNRELAGKVVRFLEDQGFETPSSLGAGSPQADDLPSLQQALSTACNHVRRSLDGLPPNTTRSTIVQLTDLGFELHELSREVYEERLSARAGSLSAVRSALSHLRGLETTAAVIETAAAEVCSTGGFDRSMVFRLEHSCMVAEAAHFGRDQDWAAAVLGFARRRPPDLKEMIVETDLARRRRPGVVQDAKTDPRAFRPLVLATDTTAYIAAPIAPEGRVIGFLHADCYFSGRPLEAADRDLLAAFAEGLGYATANAALRERLQREGRELGTLLQRTRDVVSGLATEDTDLRAPAPGDGRSRGEGSPMPPTVPATPSLTSRQMQVLRLMAEGSTNAQIADRLVVSEHTIKSHVKQILRSLGVANRTEAAAAYHRLSAESGQRSWNGDAGRG